MRTHLFRLGSSFLMVAGALCCCSGCAVFVENRYAVFGFDGLQTQSPERARAMSLAVLGGVAIGAAGLSAVAMWLVNARGHRRAESQVVQEQPTSDPPGG